MIQNALQSVSGERFAWLLDKPSALVLFGGSHDRSAGFARDEVRLEERR
nr:hypothetical protein [Phenylobacterium sp.]